MDKEEVKQIRSEIVELCWDQMDALEAQTFVGLTDEELRQYDERGARIHELSDKIRDPDNN